MNCMNCGMRLHPSNMFLFELSLEPGVKAKDAKLKQVGMTCRSLMCLALATGCGEEE